MSIIVDKNNNVFINCLPEESVKSKQYSTNKIIEKDDEVNYPKVIKN